MPTLREIGALRAMLDDLARLSAAELAAFWQLVEDLDPRAVEEALVSGYPEVITPYLAAAADVSAVWYDDLAPAEEFAAVPAPPPPVEQLEASARWAVGALFGRGAAPVLDLLTGSAQRAVYNGSRDTIIDNARREGARWARHASGNACAFCRLLATRGAVYVSQQRALRAHDHCHCMAVAVRRGDTYEPPAYVSQWENEYKQARRESDGSTDGILAVMRRNDPTT